MIDLLLIETKNGGDIVFKGNDFVTTQTFYNDVYFGLFGGNPKQNTTGTREENEPQFDFWGNLLIWENDPQVWINSRLENLLNNVALTSQTRLLIERTIETDLEFMRDFADVSVNVTIPNLDTVKIEIELTRPEPLDDSVFVFLWDSANAELTSDGIIESETGGIGTGLNNLLNLPI